PAGSAPASTGSFAVGRTVMIDSDAIAVRAPTGSGIYDRMGTQDTAGAHARRPGGPGALQGMLTLKVLEREIGQGTIDTVVAAFTARQGRRVGKGIQGECV